jgi:6-phosphogluconate dehydrogenase
MQEKARKNCLVCQLPKEIRDQLGTEASKKGFSRQDQIEWLRAACGVAQVTSAILNRHLSSRHDEREEESNGAQ